VKTLEQLATNAAGGDRNAAEGIVRAVQEDVYFLALKMLWHPADAEDATQEILVKVLTHLSTFRAESAFRTWVFRIACNHLLTARKSRMEVEPLSFEWMAEDLAGGISDGPVDKVSSADQGILAEEIKIGCTQAMLLCLDRDHRLAFVLGDVFGLTSEDAAELAEVEAAAMRKRLQRARERIRGFMQQHCGLVDPRRRCRCEKRINSAVQAKRVDPGRPLFTGRGLSVRRAPRLLTAVAEMETLHDAAAAVFRSHPSPAAPDSLLQSIRRIIDSGGFQLFS
jgi:RNA polymerase sigma factor (sigma-70 family)